MNKESIKIIIVAIEVIILIGILSFCFIQASHQTINQAGGVQKIIIQKEKIIKPIYKDINNGNYTNPMGFWPAS